MYIDVWGSFLSSMFVIGSSYVSSLRSHVICIALSSICERDEWPSPKDSESLSFPSLYSLLMWLHFMFDLSRLPHFFIYSLFRCHLCHCLWFISFAVPHCPFLTLTYSRCDVSLSSFLHISLSVWFASLSYYWHHIHVRHPQVHGSRDLLYMLHFTYEGMGFWSLGIWA